MFSEILMTFFTPINEYFKFPKILPKFKSSKKMNIKKNSNKGIVYLFANLTN